MAYSATSRIIHKLFINVNPNCGIFLGIFRLFFRLFQRNRSGFARRSKGKLLLSVVGDMQVFVS